MDVGGGCAACIRCGALLCPVLLRIEFSVSAQYQKNRALLRAWRVPLLLQQLAAVRGVECGMDFKMKCNESIKFLTLG